MSTFNFSEAKAVFHPSPTGDEVAVSQYGFYTTVDLPAAESVKLSITARNVYRLYING